LKRAGFTLVELLVVMAIIATLAALVVPMIFSAQETAKRAECGNNLKSMGQAMILYKKQKGKGRYYPRYDGKKFVVALYRSGILSEPKVFMCPSTGDDNDDGKEYGTDRKADVPAGTCSYAGRMNRKGSPFMIITQLNQMRVPPSRLAIISDGLVPVGGEGVKKFNHGDGANVLFADWHVSFLDLEEDLLGREEIGPSATKPLDGLSDD
jgi:prepilin-type N-terminal cleavage/methylation domain-containing protein/prepilin-type processing-associated H-X9-DG protein